eukprot:9004457-Heterocapsa_arctica.AAC.1
MRDIRAHAAALQHVALISSEYSIAKAMNAKGQLYAAERASGSEATLLGAPHHHVWAAMILEMVKFLHSSKAAFLSAAGSPPSEGAC